MKLLLALLLSCLPFNGSNGGKELLDKALERCERLETLESYRDILSRYGVSDRIPLTCPLKDRFRKSSGFGIRIHPITGKRSFHSGIDMAVGSKSRQRGCNRVCGKHGKEYGLPPAL